MRLATILPKLHRRAAAVVLASIGLTGCVGSLDDPQRFGDGSFCPPEIEIETLFTERCGGAICHGAGAEPAGGLDLESPGLADRLLSVPAEECVGWDRVVPNDPDSSFLIAKLEGPPPGCGDPMPTVGHLSEQEINCVREWIVDISGGGEQQGDGVDDGLDGGVQ